MSGGSLNAENALNWLFTQNGKTESVGNVRELLFLSPLNVEFGALVVIVVMSVRVVLQGLLVIDLLSLREPRACGLPPSVIEIEEHVIQVLIPIANALNLIEVRGYVADLVEVLGADLADVKVDHMAIVGVDLGQLVLSQVLGVEPVLHVDVLVRQDDRRVAVVVAGGLAVEDLEVLVDFVLINLKEEVRLSLDLSVDVSSQSFALFAI